VTSAFRYSWLTLLKRGIMQLNGGVAGNGGVSVGSLSRQILVVQTFQQSTWVTASVGEVVNK
jgi:hypothetical protein